MARSGLAALGQPQLLPPQPPAAAGSAAVPVLVSTQLLRVDTSGDEQHNLRYLLVRRPSADLCHSGRGCQCQWQLPGGPICEPDRSRGSDAGNVLESLEQGCRDVVELRWATYLLDVSATDEASGRSRAAGQLCRVYSAPLGECGRVADTATTTSWVVGIQGLQALVQAGQLASYVVAAAEAWSDPSMIRGMGE
eukprot:SAG22_NODE_8303_length_666_cov_0.746032_1_plen_193_part_01